MKYQYLPERDRPSSETLVRCLHRGAIWIAVIWFGCFIVWDLISHIVFGRE